MRVRALFSVAIVLPGSLAALTACGGGAAPSAPAIASVQTTQSLKDSDLLYVANTRTGEVYVYTYPHGKLVQTLTNYGKPYGECVDKSGDVFITLQGGDGQIVEYAHGASAPKATLPGYLGWSPYGCAVDPKNGDLAVAWTSNATSNPEFIEVVPPDGAAVPLTYYAGFGLLYFCGYNDKDDLFLDQQSWYYSGEYETRIVQFQLRNGNAKFTWSPEYWLTNPGGVQWDGKYLAVSDSAKTIYRFSIANGKATKVDKTTLAGIEHLYQFFIDGNQVIGGDYSAGTVDEWKYPGGGKPTQLIAGMPQGTTAVAISPGK